MPWRTAPACPDGPPPCTRTRRSYWPSSSVSFSGAFTITRWTSRGKYSSIVRPLTQVLPSPGRRITRASEVVRLPVARYWAGCESVDDIRATPSSERLGGLRLVGMLGAGVDLQLRDLLVRELVLREHALDGLADDLGRAPLELVAQRTLLEPSGVARV